MIFPALSSYLAFGLPSFADLIVLTILLGVPIVIVVVLVLIFRR